MLMQINTIFLVLFESQSDKALARNIDNNVCLKLHQIVAFVNRDGLFNVNGSTY